MFDWAEYLLLAVDWSRQDGEGNKRSAISRAYYSVFRRAENYLVEIGALLPYEEKNNSLSKEKEEEKMKKSHDAIWKAFYKLGHDGKRIHDIGERLKDLRIKADYRNEIRGDINMKTEKTIIEAQELEQILLQMSKKNKETKN